MNEAKSTTLPRFPAFALCVLLGLPTMGFLALVQTYSNPTMQKLLGPKFELCAWLWMLASFWSCSMITGKVLDDVVTDERYNDVRKRLHWWSKLTRWSLSAWVILGLVALPVSRLVPLPLGHHHILNLNWLSDPILNMKFLALAAAMMMWRLDKHMVKVVQTNSDLKEQFEDTVRYIDVPTLLAVVITLALSCIYSMDYFPFEGKFVYSQSPERVGNVFVGGLSSGAVAVELCFANFLYWILSRRGECLSK